MKIAILFVALVSLPTLAGTLKVSSLKSEANMDRSFLLRTQLKDKVLLDCQSFMQGIYIGPRDGGAFFMMEPDECESLYGRIRASHKKWQKHCIEIEDVVVSDEAC